LLKIGKWRDDWARSIPEYIDLHSVEAKALIAEPMHGFEHSLFDSKDSEYMSGVFLFWKSSPHVFDFRLGENFGEQVLFERAMVLNIDPKPDEMIRFAR